MSDYLTNLSARSLNKARVIRPRFPMHFESQIQKEPLYQKESREIIETAETYDKKRSRSFPMTSSFDENIQVEPKELFPEIKQTPISESQTLQRASITSKASSHHMLTQQPEQPGKLTGNMAIRNEMIEPGEKKWHRLSSTDISIDKDVQAVPQLLNKEVKQLPIFKSQTLQRARMTNQVFSHQSQTQQPERPRNLIENVIVGNEIIESGEKNYNPSINPLKLKRATPNEYPRIPSEQESITIKPSVGDNRMNDIDDVFSSPISSKSYVDKTQKSSISTALEMRKNALIPTSQYQETGRFESDIVKTLLPKKRIEFRYTDPFTVIKKSGRVFTPEFSRKYSQGFEIDAQKTTSEEKSIQVTIGRIEIRTASPEKPQKKHRAPHTLSLEDYSKRHTEEVDR